MSSVQFTETYKRESCEGYAFFVAAALKELKRARVQSVCEATGYIVPRGFRGPCDRAGAQRFTVEMGSHGLTEER